jgi:hypothetical protein
MPTQCLGLCTSAMKKVAAGRPHRTDGPSHPAAAGGGVLRARRGAGPRVQRRRAAEVHCRRAVPAGTAGTFVAGLWMADAAVSVESGLRPQAGRLIGPLPIQSDDAELDVIAHADDPGVLGDRVIHRAPQAVGDKNRRAAEPPRNGAGRPRLPGHAPLASLTTKAEGCSNGCDQTHRVETGSTGIFSGWEHKEQWRMISSGPARLCNHHAGPNPQTWGHTMSTGSARISDHRVIFMPSGARRGGPRRAVCRSSTARACPSTKVDPMPGSGQGSRPSGAGIGRRRKE